MRSNQNNSMMLPCALFTFIHLTLLSAALQQARRRLRRFLDLMADVRLIQQHLLKAERERDSSEKGDFARGCCCNKSSREAWLCTNRQEAVLFSVLGGGEA
ncbi:hypothetical protein SADUNF_Sadunf03G0009600 [Salix dunnii]|uniref:Secreted protein n=1 Tax=Salix dunnii TaxID=1413687 RepID=A0A835KAL7_9ROSI|nr:hypothetical protein SADUNF_Sadunf03G0009600 [Salix dunnii]